MELCNLLIYSSEGPLFAGANKVIMRQPLEEYQLKEAISADCSTMTHICPAPYVPTSALAISSKQFMLPALPSTRNVI